MEHAELLTTLDKKSSPEQIGADIESLYRSFRSEDNRNDDDDGDDGDSFDTDADLTALDKCLEFMQCEMQAKEAELRSIVRQAVRHATESAGGSQSLGAGKEAIEKLFLNLDLANQTCSQSDDRSLSALNEIKSLHYAKINVSRCLAALEDIEALVSALESLKLLLSASRSYADILPLFERCKSLARKYEAYQDIDGMGSLFNTLQATESQLEHLMLAEFKDSFSMQGLMTGKLGTLEKICLIVDLMGHAAIGRMQRLYSQIQLKEFLTAFRSADKIAAMLHFSERQEWFEERLRSIEQDHLSIFPKSWNVLCFLSKEYISVLCEDLSKALEADHRFELGQLVQLKQAINSFENFISSKLGLKSSIISDCVEPFMRPIVDEQEKILRAVMDMIKRKSIEADLGRENILQSSFQLISAYQSIFQTMAALSRKQCLADTASLFSSYFGKYCGFLMDQCAALVDARREALLAATLGALCRVLNTASYCITTAQDVEVRFKSDIDVYYQEAVSFCDAVDGLRELIATVIEHMRRLFDDQATRLLESFHKLDWTSAAERSLAEHSGHARNLVRMLDAHLPTLRSLIADAGHYRSFHCRLVDLLSRLYVRSIYKCKSISESGAEKMLMDLDLLQNALLSAENRPVALPQAREMFSRAQQTLQAILCPTQPPQAFIEKYRAIFQHEAEPSHLGRLLELKGLRRAEQDKYIDLLNRQNATLRQ